ncbi:MAG: hypothetical protein ACYCPQ_10060 [Elusimicrobiota bacterium]
MRRALLEGEIKPGYARRNRFAIKYTNFDKELPAQADNAHGRLSGPATRKILQRQYAVYGDKLCTLSTVVHSNSQRKRNKKKGTADDGSLLIFKQQRQRQGERTQKLQRPINGLQAHSWIGKC